ncbi:MAG: 4Fe-4S dicluster domain-containing protein [Chloroflexota bacterium]|jgi:formate dehydrogenase iron-sulfur subunit
MIPAILTDVTKCIGCEKCVEACVNANDLGEYRPGMPPSKQEIGDGLSAVRWTSVLAKPGKHFVRNQCRHCLEPACVSACLVGAMKKSPEGPIIYDQSICMGCRYCMVACPFGIPRYDWSTPVPYVNKCTMCFSRLKEGKQPACVEACPEKATIFGERDELLAEAARRLKAEPGKYMPHIYGEHEAGGTSVMYISDIELDFFNLSRDVAKEMPKGLSKSLPQKPFPELTRPVMESVPFVGLGMTVLSGGLSWIIGRRIQMARIKAEEMKRSREGGEEKE